MTNSDNKLTVGLLRELLSDYPLSMEVTFGATKFNKRPLFYYRFKVRGEKLIQLELNELEGGSEDISECEGRITVETLLDGVKGLEDDWQIVLGSSNDRAPLVFDSITPVVAFNIIQPNEARYRMEDKM
jgi:hypothetical protein